MFPLHYKIANDDRGTQEISGPYDNKRIVEMFAEAGHSYIDDDETAWCAAAMGSWLRRAGLPSTGKLNARSYLDYGEPVALEDAQLGDIVVFWRDHPNSWKGHVALYEGQTNNRVKVLGGNQSSPGKVNSAYYPKGRVLGVRRPVYRPEEDHTGKRKLDEAFLRDIFPNGRESWLKALPGPLNEVMAKYEINTPRRIAMFLANIYTETGGLTTLEENLNYSPKRLMEVWPTRFKSLTKARQYAHSPERLGNYVYNRFGNKGIPGAGYKYRGRGLLQATFIDNYRKIEEATGLPVVDNPDLLLIPKNAALQAGVYWDQRNVNKWADEGDVEGARRAVNGGTIGLDRTKRAYSRILPMVQDLNLVKPGVEGGIIGTGIGGGVIAVTQNPNIWGAAAAILMVAAAGGLVYYLRKRKRRK